MTEIQSPQPPKHDIGNYVSEAFGLFTKDLVKWVGIGFIGQLALCVGYWGGFQHCAQKQLRGETLEFTDVLFPFQQFGRLFIPSLIAGVAISVGLLFCFLPGMIAAVLLGTWWFFLWPILLANPNMGWKEAAEISKTTAKKDFMGTFIVALVAGFLGGLGGVVAMFFLTAGLTGIIQVLAYNATFGTPGAGGGAAAGGWGSLPAPQPAGQPAHVPGGPEAWGSAPPQAAPAAPAPQAAWGAPAAQAPPAPEAAWGAPAAPAAPAAAPASAPESGTETAVQTSTSNPDEAFTGGRTMAMSAVDFEKMLKGGNSNSQG